MKKSPSDTSFQVMVYPAICFPKCKHHTPCPKHQTTVGEGYKKQPTPLSSTKALRSKLKIATNIFKIFLVSVVGAICLLVFGIFATLFLVTLSVIILGFGIWDKLKRLFKPKAKKRGG